MFPRSAYLRIVTAAGVFALVAGCGERADGRLSALTLGITKDSATKVMGSAPEKEDRFLVNGQHVESMYYPKSESTAADRFEVRQMTPVVVVNGKLTGWGWAYWDSVAAANKFQVSSSKK